MAEHGEAWLEKIRALQHEHSAVARFLRVVQKDAQGTIDENVDTFLSALGPLVEAHYAARGTSQ
jgi:hypothetical protein